MQALGAVLFAGWVLLTLCLIGALVRRISDWERVFWVRIAAVLALVGGFAFLQVWAVVGSLMIGYCENCAGKPIEPRDIVIFLMLLAPTALLAALWWFTKRKTPNNWAG